MDAYQRRALELLSDPETTRYPTRADREALKAILAERDELLELAKVIEEWWLCGEMEKHYGAPAFVFTARSLIARANGGP